MDDTAQQNQSVLQRDSVGQQVPLKQPPIHQPLSATPTKEHAPVPVHSEYVKPSPPESFVEVDAEVAKHVEHSTNPEQLKPSEEHEKLGVKASGEAMAAPQNLSDDHAFPLTPTQVADSQSKQYTVWDQFKWFGAVVGRQMLRAQKKLFK